MTGFALPLRMLLLAGLPALLTPASPAVIERGVLANGAVFLYANDGSSGVTSVEIFVRGGKAAVPPGKEGLASMTTRLALEITDARKAQDMMAQATRLGAATLDDFSIIALECLSENLEQALKSTADMILDPLFTGPRIDGLRDYLSHLARIEEDDTAALGHRTALQTLFSGTGYGASAHGTPESLKALKKKDIQLFYENRFRAGNMVFSVISDLERERVRGLIEKAFAKLQPGSAAEDGPPPLPPSPPASGETRVEKETRQNYVALAFPLPPLAEKTYLLALAFENMLGKGPGSRLWPLRSELRLAYTVNALATPMRNGGLLEAYLETDGSKAEEALTALRATFESLVREGVGAEELRVTKACLRTQFLRDNEMKTPRARTIGTLEALGLGGDFFDRIPEAIERLTTEEMTAYLRSVLDPARALTVVVGPGKN
jgi:zinc protease